MNRLCRRLGHRPRPSRGPVTTCERCWRTMRSRPSRRPWDTWLIVSYAGRSALVRKMDDHEFPLLPHHKRTIDMGVDWGDVDTSPTIIGVQQ